VVPLPALVESGIDADLSGIYGFGRSLDFAVRRLGSVDSGLDRCLGRRRFMRHPKSAFSPAFCPRIGAKAQASAPGFLETCLLGTPMATTMPRNTISPT